MENPPNPSAVSLATTQSAKPRRRWYWRLLRWGLIGLASIITLVFLVFTIENWRGKRAWEKFKREWEAKGEKFELRAFVPPTVPDDQNFTMTPFLAPLYDFNPMPLQPGQDHWRDTNGFNRAKKFINDLRGPEMPKLSTARTSQRQTDLIGWALAFQGKTNEPATDRTSMTSPEAAKVVLDGLEKYRPIMDEISVASRRPFARFNIRYDTVPAVAILMPHMDVVKNLALLFQLRASAELASGRTNEALADVKVILRLSDAVKDEPFLIAGLVRISVLQTAMRPVWEGLAAHQWSDAQLAELGEQLGSLDLLAEYVADMRGERAAMNETLNYLYNSGAKFGGELDGAENIAHWTPAGWLYQNQLTINLYFQEVYLPPVDVARHRISLALAKAGDPRLDRELNSGFPPYKFFARLLIPALGKAQQKYAVTQVSLEQAMLACALERHRLARASYPQTLEALAPDFIKTVPHDITTGEPLKYRRNDDGTFLLYSIGWNEKDDGGQIVPAAKSNGAVDLTQGDWVWPPYPVK